MSTSQWKRKTPDKEGVHWVIRSGDGLLKSGSFLRVNVSAGQKQDIETDDMEMVFCLIAGVCKVAVNGKEFDCKKLDSVYAPFDSKVTIRAFDEPVVLYVPAAKSDRKIEPYKTVFDMDIPIGDRKQVHGEGVVQKDVFMAVGPQDPACRIIAGYKWGREGMWTSWPPHQHQEHLEKGKATICIVNYKTLDFTRLCLRSIRKFTTYPYEVIVVDNDSKDESLDYLKSLSWIKLLERKNPIEPVGGYAHSHALDLAFENCRTEYFVSMHSDTFIKKQGWLSKMVSYIVGKPNTFSVGTGKIELTSFWREVVKKASDFETFKRKIMRTPDPTGKYRYYNRTICCLYRTAIIRKESLDFTAGREIGLTAGKKLHFDLADRGYDFVKLRPKELGEYVIHLAHATQAINPSEFNLRKKTINKCDRLIKKIMSDGVIKSILADDSLD